MGETLSTRVDEMVAGGVATKTLKGKPGSGQKKGKGHITLDMSYGYRS
jgi:hypothetical protein